LPTYHFAHVVDDFLMGTTHVLRGDEWLSSLTLHLQLFDRLGWKRPVYGHLSPIQKIEGSSRRKLSKRKDPEANMEYYTKEGFPKESIIMYLLNLANASFEDWLKNNPGKDLKEYPLLINELKRGAGSLLDLKKIESFSKDFIGTLKTEEIFDRAIAWAKEFDSELETIMQSNRDYTMQILNIDRVGDKARKDIIKWGDLRYEIGFFFDEIYSSTVIDEKELSDVSKDDIKTIAEKSVEIFNANLDKDTWLAKMREMGATVGYAPDAKTFKASPDKFKGNFGTVAKVVRVLLAGRNQSPDLYEIMNIMGKDRIQSRLLIT